MKSNAFLKGKHRFFQTSVVINTDNSLTYVSVPGTFVQDCRWFAGKPGSETIKSGMKTIKQSKKQTEKLRITGNSCKDKLCR